MTALSFSAKLRLWNNGEAPASWHFLTLPKDVATEIRNLTQSLPRKGRGSVKVEVHIGFYKRKTSIFPDKKTDSYLLPVKAEARKELQIKDGDEIFISLMLI